MTNPIPPDAVGNAAVSDTDPPQDVPQTAGPVEGDVDVLPEDV